jgi:hypothetical protein
VVASALAAMVAVPAALVGATPGVSAAAVLGILAVFAGTGTAGVPTPGGAATNSNLDSPEGVAVDGAGNVYIADTHNHEIEKVTPAGVLSVIAGTGTDGPPTAGPATSSDLNNPFGVTVDGAGNVYIADSSNSQIEKVTPAGALSVIAGTGTEGPPTAGPATNSDFGFPTGVAVDGAGNVYIADRGNNEIEKVTPATVAVTVTGSQTVGGTPTFTPTATPPAGITLTGTASCDQLTNGTAITAALPAGSYTIDGSTCSGLALSGTGASNYTIAYTGGAFTVSNPPPVPTLSVGDTAVWEGDAGVTFAYLAVTLSPSSASDVTFNLVTTGSTGGIHRFSVVGGPGTIAAGTTSTTVQIVQIRGDTIQQPDEFVQFAIENTTTPIARGTGTVTVLDDDPPPAGPYLEVSNATVVEPTSGTVVANFMVTVAGPWTVGQTITFDYTTLDATATAPRNYVAHSGTLTVGNKNLYHLIRVVVRGHPADPATKTFSLQLSNPRVGAGQPAVTIMHGTGTGTILGKS